VFRTRFLPPGYPQDTTADGLASPLHGLAGSAGDPVQAWDRFGNVYYGGIAFNRTQPANGSIWVARYNWVAGALPDYQGTAIVSRGTPSPIFLGHFNDKVMIEVDRSANAATTGNVYVCWALFTASGPNNGVFFSRSTDGGRTFSNRMKVSDSVHGNQSCDVGVGSTGRVWVAWRQYEFQANQGQRQRDAVAYVYSTDGGQSFTKPALATEFIHWNMGDTTGDPGAAGQAGYEACLVGDATLGRCEGPDPRVNARDCGDGPVRVPLRLCLRTGRLERAHLGRSHAWRGSGRGVRAGRRNRAGDGDPDRIDLLDGQRRHRQPGVHLSRQDDGRRRQLVDVAGGPATQGPPVLQRRRRLRGTAARRLPRHAQRHGGRRARRSRSRTSGSAGRSARRTPSRASRRGTRARRTAA
jgi:hypothetical protein